MTLKTNRSRHQACRLLFLAWHTVSPWRQGQYMASQCRNHTLHSCHQRNLKSNSSGSILHQHIYFYLPSHMFLKLLYVKPELMQCLPYFHQPYSCLYHVNECCNSRGHTNFSQCQIWTHHPKIFMCQSQEVIHRAVVAILQSVRKSTNLCVVVFICSLSMLPALSWTGHPIIPRLHSDNLYNYVCVTLSWSIIEST
jgi:hypothetical protein